MKGSTNAVGVPPTPPPIPKELVSSKEGSEANERCNEAACVEEAASAVIVDEMERMGSPRKDKEGDVVSIVVVDMMVDY